MFFAGMALGIVAGAAFGIGIMCCVVAGKQEDQQMEQMRIRRQKQGEPKTIHFRDREGIERFSLLDGECLCMMAEDGTKADWALLLCGWETGGCEWPGLGYWGISLSDGMQKNPGVSAGRE